MKAYKSLTAMTIVLFFGMLAVDIYPGALRGDRDAILSYSYLWSAVFGFWCSFTLWRFYREETGARYK